LDFLRGLKGLPSRDRLHAFLRAGEVLDVAWPGRPVVAEMTSARAAFG